MRVDEGKRQTDTNNLSGKDDRREEENKIWEEKKRGKRKKVEKRE